MLCEVVLSSLWFLFVIFWVETISVWLYLSIFYQWEHEVFTEDPRHTNYMFNRANHIQEEMPT